MDNIHIFEKAASLLDSGENVALVTVIATTGSTPGKVGYKMLVFGAEPQTAGTVGGGLVEAQMIAHARRMLPAPGKRVFQFDLGHSCDDPIGICGGTVELLIETFGKDAQRLFKDLATAVTGESSAVLLSILDTENRHGKIILSDTGTSDLAADGRFAPEIVSAVRRLAAAGHGAEKVSAGAAEVFIESLAQPPNVVLFGAGHVSYHIARIAKAVHLKVTVYDDRQEYANTARFPDVDDVIVADFDQILEHVLIEADSYIVIVTRGHKWDETVLEQALQTKARYIGMIGSRRKTKTIIENLRRRGACQETLSRVYSPIGLAIGAVTAEEIALSIVGELVKIRRLGRAAPVTHLSVTESGDRL